MKILQIAPYFTFRQGGVSEMVYQLCCELTNTGHQVTLLTSDFLAEEKPIRHLDFELVQLPSYAIWGLYVTPSMANWLKKNLPFFDLVHLHEFRTLQNITSCFYASKIGTPIIFTGHGTIPNILSKRGVKRLFDLLFRNFLLKRIDYFCAVSKQEVVDFKEIGIQHTRIKLIFNGVKIYSANVTSNHNTKDHFTHSKAAFKILYLGRLHKIKRIDRLIEAFAIVIKKYPQANLVIAGPDCGVKKNLVKQAWKLALFNSVSFPGSLYGERKFSFYKSGAVLVYPSCYEVFGLVPFEALLCGTPVVVSAETGMGKLISAANAGKTFPQDNPKALAEAILWTVENPIATQDQIKAGQNFIHTHLEWSKIARAYEGVYREAAEIAA